MPDQSRNIVAKNLASSSKAPGFESLELATLADAVPQGPEWVHEVKFDGYRTLAVIDAGKVTMYSRSGLDWTRKYRALAKLLQDLDVESAVIDGEIVALNEHGASSFSKLKDELGAERSQNLQYYVFDLLHLNGQDLKKQTLLERKGQLERLVKGRDLNDRIIYSEHFAENPDFLPHLCSLEMEGLISKRIDSTYTGKRSKAWLKVKCHKRQEFLIVGYTDSKAGRDFRSLLLGYYDQGQLKFAGKVGTGFNQDSQAEIMAKIEGLSVIPKPFKKLPPDVGRGTWIEPKLVCEIEFTEWTPEGRLRHPSFQGLREDKKPESVGRDKEMPVGKAVKAAKAEVAKEAPRRRHPSAPLKGPESA
ncbi:MULTISPECIES: non-homologous end-joining DNA ligase [Asticcacaulis]|uniref:non-homologous end-joining DNA ligase n=1 Tax=Asticcacaulis TaxID=76890 RepID=UPI001AE662B1|nr:non-homologous end-joining DNA ligase [Asticcacaulis sp. BE141]MBP2159566.1 DNA ligase D-like protein (predicted ligase) [Asticcacaulis solisilvae]MDR6800607.1 DNA ligase D-like protein (predicted ligase) [Asticcacaulis sp. BE141]